MNKKEERWLYKWIFTLSAGCGVYFTWNISESETTSGWVKLKSYKGRLSGRAGRWGARWHQVTFTLDFLALKG